jgi:hypothetical protein
VVALGDRVEPGHRANVLGPVATPTASTGTAAE